MNLRQWMRIDLGALLRGRGVVVAEPLPDPPGVKRTWWGRLYSGVFRRKNTARNLVLVTDQLRQLVVCQAPLAEGLKHAATDCPSLAVSRQLYRLGEALEQGGTLAEGLRRFPTFCPRYYVDLVAAAENSGYLNETLLELSRDLEQDQKTRNMLRGRTVYILTVLCIALAFGIFLQIKVFPVLADVGAEMGGPARALAGFWNTLMGCLDSLRGFVVSLDRVFTELFYGIFGQMTRSSSYFDGLLPISLPSLVLCGLGLVALVAVLLLFPRRPVRFLFERLPIIRRAMFLTRWSHALKVVSLLLDRGVPLDLALESAAGSDLDRSTRRALLRMREATRTGLSFPEVLDRERRGVPCSLRSAVAFGERTGRLPDLLSRLSDVYQLRAERIQRVTLDIAFPLAVIGCGVLIASINTRFFVLMTNMVDGIMGSM